MNKDDLKANLEDRIYTRKKNSNTTTIISAVAVIAVFGAFGFKYYQEKQEKKALIERIAEIDRQIEEKRQSEEQALKERLRNMPKSHEQESSRLRITEPSEPTPKRQTVFNDDNYKPRQPVNRMPAVRAEPPPVRQRTRPQNTVTTKWVPWTWEKQGNGLRKGRVGGQFKYVVRNGVIDTASVCNNEKFGSFRYRDCRKAAKKHFSDRCRSGDKEACSGAGMAP